MLQGFFRGIQFQQMESIMPIQFGAKLPIQVQNQGGKRVVAFEDPQAAATALMKENPGKKLNGDKLEIRMADPKADYGEAEIYQNGKSLGIPMEVEYREGSKRRGLTGEDREANDEFYGTNSLIDGDFRADIAEIERLLEEGE